ncbi:MAG: choice-of-anchor D domain-containing protein [Terriglobales bacterium]
MSRKSEFSFLSLLCVVVLLAAAMSPAQTAPSQDADPNAAQAATQSGAATIAPSQQPMAYPKAQRRRNNPAARRQFLAQLNQRSASSVPHNKKASPAFGGTWQAGTNSAPDPLGFTGNPLLLTDGTVIVSDGGFVGNWYKLTPDITGSYVNGTWTQIATMPVINGVQYAPSDNASAVLPDGRVIVMGGEYNWQAINELPVDTNLGAIYDPVANTWTPVSAPAGSSWSKIGDAMSTVLADGTFLLGSCCSVPSVDALFDATNLTWTSTGAPIGGSEGQDEQGYTLLPNGNVLTVDIFNSGVGYNSAEQYDAGSGAWSSAGNTGTRLYDICGSIEIGPAPLRPDGTVVQFGGYACGFDDTYPSATPDPTGIYDSTTGTWSAGPDVPVVDGLFFSIPDGPAAVLPNGNILFAASPWAGFANEPPTHFFEFTTANTINQVADAPDGVSEFGISSEFNFLVLPNGQILVDVGADPQLFYTPTGSPDPSWAPVISTSPSSVYPGTTYTITGTQLNGLTQGAYFGDDVQAATNYPIVQITNSATGHVFYGRTFNISNRSVAPGVSVSTDFTVPANIEWGPSTLVVIANGIPSTPVPVGIAVPTVGVSSSLNPSVYGQAVSFTATVTGASPTGSVQFNIDGGAFGSPATLASGTATSGTTSTLSPGAHTVTAVYSGDTNNAQGTGSLNGGQVVNQSSVNVTVATSPSGLLVSVDGGSAQASPVVVSWTIASSHTIATTSPQGSGGTQYTWSSWSDGGAISHQVTASANVTGYTASFNTSYLLTTAANPTNGGTVAPASGTYYAPNTIVNLSATPNPNYAFSNWTGNVANANSASTTVTMTGPQSVTANFVAASLTVSPASVNFGNVKQCQTKKAVLTLTNNASTKAQIGALSFIDVTGNPNDFTYHEYCRPTLDAGKHCTIAVTFSPSEDASESATLNIPTSGGTFQVPITGTGVANKKCTE